MGRGVERGGLRVKKLTEEEIAKEKAEFNKIALQKLKDKIKFKYISYSREVCEKRLANNRHYIEVSIRDSANSDPFSAHVSINCRFCGEIEELRVNSDFYEDIKKWLEEEEYR